jgi:hypothetical protein
MVYDLETGEAKDMVLCGRGSLWDRELQKIVETPQEWLTVVEEKATQEKTSDEWIQTLEELQKLYVETFGKELSIRYKNDIERIKSKLYS